MQRYEGLCVNRYVVHRHGMCVVIRMHVSGQSVLPYEGVLVVHRHVMCVVIRMYPDIRFLPVAGGREARAEALVPATRHAPPYMSLNV